MQFYSFSNILYVKHITDILCYDMGYNTIDFIKNKHLTLKFRYAIL